MPADIPRRIEGHPVGDPGLHGALHSSPTIRPRTSSTCRRAFAAAVGVNTMVQFSRKG